MAANTSKELLDKALKRRNELLIELEALESFIQTYEKLLSVRDVDGDSSSDEPGLFQPPSKRHAHAEKIAEMIAAARRIIILENRPMKRGDLRERVEALGHRVIGKDKNKVFGTNLWRSGKFQMIEGRGYWPADVELPPES